MSFTRIWQSGAEMQHVNELEELASSTYGGASNFTISSTKAKTGTYSFRGEANSYPRGKAVSATQIRAGAFVNHTSVGGASSLFKAILFLVTTSGGVADAYVIWNGATGDLELYVGGSMVDSINVATAGFDTTNTWYHLGFTYKADSSTGFVSLYRDGVQILNWTGNTGTAITGVYFHGDKGSSGGWANYAYWDDFYVDSASGEADAAPPSNRLMWQAVSGAGASAAWTASGAGSNYQCVDDGVPNDDTDYVLASSSGLVDYYATGDITLPTGYSVVALIPCAWAKKTDAGTGSQLKLGSRLSSTDSTGSAQTLATTYGPIMERQTTKPGGGSWSETDVNNSQVKIESAGAF